MDDDAPDTGDYIEFTYDCWNRLTSETRHISQDTLAVTYLYDVANRLTKLTYPDNTQILYSYDDLNRITEIKRYVDGENDEILLDNVQYNTESLLIQFDFGNDLRSTFTYDSRHRFLTIDLKDGETSYLDLDYTYDNNSNIIQLTNGWKDTTSTWHSQTESYNYDGLDRLTSASCNSWSHTYSYDKTGNRTARDGVTYTLNSVNEVTALSDGTSFTYDSNGSRTEKTKGEDSWEYTYDYANRLTKLEKNNTILGEYVYDGDGKRIQVTENGETTTCIYLGFNVLYEENTTGIAVYIYGPTGKIAKITTIQSETDTFYYHTDHLGSIRMVTDESKNIITDATYEPFGESTITGEESYLYTGKKKDSTSLYYYGARYYDPDVARFITRDPLSGKKAIPQSLNRYTYCLNNPLKLTDPSGLTYRMCNVGNGVCTRYYEWYRPNGIAWTAYDKNGEKITDSKEIQELLDETDKDAAQIREDKARAVYLMLLITHPEIEGDPNQIPKILSDGGFRYEVSIEGEKVYIWIKIRDEWESEEGHYADTFPSSYMEESGEFVDMIKIVVYQATFQSIAWLYHIIGHEGVHVYELATIATTYEYHAYMWNLRHVYHPFPFPLGRRKLEALLEMWKWDQP
jgi:RHS repeat-associated protein